MIEIGTFSGQVDGDSGYIGVQLRNNEHVYARPIMQPPFLSLPDKSWVDTYGKKFQAVISYEMSDGQMAPATPILIGAIPLKNPNFPDEGYTEKYFVYSKKFKVILNDKDNKCVVFRLDDKGKIYWGSDTDSQPVVLGNNNESVLKDLAKGIQDIIDAVASSGVTPQDGGAQFKANLTTALTATKNKMIAIQNTDAKNTKSSVVNTI